MKIRRYLLTIYDCDVHENKEGDWVKYEDVKPLLERIEELEERQCDCIDWDEIAREREQR